MAGRPGAFAGTALAGFLLSGRQGHRSAPVLERNREWPLRRPERAAGRTGRALRLGRGRYRWRVDAGHVDMAMPAPSPAAAAIAAEPQAVTVDLDRTAMIVIDMQNDFCAKGGWVDQLGADIRRIARRSHRCSVFCRCCATSAVPIIWVNWGNRPDLMNMPPNQLHLYKPTGTGIGLGEPLPGAGAHVLEKDSWAAAIVDELPVEPGDIRVDKHRISGFWDTPLELDPAQSRYRVAAVRRRQHRPMRAAHADRCQFPWLWLHHAGRLLRHHVAGVLHRGDALERQKVLRLRRLVRRRSCRHGRSRIMTASGIRGRSDTVETRQQHGDAARPTADLGDAGRRMPGGAAETREKNSPARRSESSPGGLPRTGSTASVATARCNPRMISTITAAGALYLAGAGAVLGKLRRQSCARCRAVAPTEGIMRLFDSIHSHFDARPELMSTCSSARMSCASRFLRRSRKPRSSPRRSIGMIARLLQRRVTGGG